MRSIMDRILIPKHKHQIDWAKEVIENQHSHYHFISSSMDRVLQDFPTFIQYSLSILVTSELCPKATKS